MNTDELARDAIAAMRAGTRMTLTRERGTRKPPRFPKGELLCENFDGRNCYSYDPVKVLTWMTREGLVKLQLPPDKVPK